MKKTFLGKKKRREIETGLIESVPNLCSNYGVILNANAF
jgi:hypothetical protein